MKYEVQGIDTLVDRLASLRKVQLKAAIRKGSRSGAKVIAARVKSQAPRKTGVLAAAVKVRALPRSRRWTGTQVTIKAKDSPAFYAGFRELGTKKMPAGRFERDAVADTREQASRAVIEAITAALEKAGR